MNLLRDNTTDGNIIIVEKAGFPALVEISDLGAPWSDESLVTVDTATWNTVVNLQSQPTIGTAVFFFALGFGVSSARLSGYVFYRNCQGAGANSVQEMQQSFLSKSPVFNNNPVRISVSGYSLSGFLKELKFEASTQIPNMSQWTLDMDVIPPSAKGSS